MALSLNVTTDCQEAGYGPPVASVEPDAAVRSSGLDDLPEYLLFRDRLIERGALVPFEEK